MATLIYTNGETKEVAPKDPKNGFSLEELYSMLDCELVEILYPIKNDGTIIVCDEEGMQKEKEINFNASDHFGYHFLVGTCLICQSDEVK